jgi:hypothetical protein
MKELSTSSMRRLYRASHNVLREDARAEAKEAASREFERLLDLEAVKILSRATLTSTGTKMPRRNWKPCVSYCCPTMMKTKRSRGAPRSMLNPPPQTKTETI